MTANSTAIPRFWRQIRLEAWDGICTGDVADNVHHFRVAIEHSDGVVTKVSGEAVRVPWTTCPFAVGQLQAIVGASLNTEGRLPVEQTAHCTHWLDLARLAVAHSLRGGTRVYDVEVRPSSGDGDDLVADLSRDGAPFLTWTARGDKVTSPGPFVGHALAGRALWPREINDDPDLREAALVMRRSIYIFQRHATQPEHASLRTAAQIDLRNVCYSFNDSRIDQAVRPPGFTIIP